MAIPKRQAEIEAIERFIAEHGVKQLEPFTEKDARRKWNVGKPTVNVNGDGRRTPEKRDGA
jgi:hypothetical protein